LVNTEIQFSCAIYNLFFLGFCQNIAYLVRIGGNFSGRIFFSRFYNINDRLALTKWQKIPYFPALPSCSSQYTQ